MKTKNHPFSIPDEIWTLANLISVSRASMLPWLIASYSHGHYLCAAVVLVYVAISDICDGLIARRTGTASEIGAAVDITADCLVTIGFQVYLYSVTDLPVYLPILAVGSIISFLLGVPERRKIVRNPIGRYAGAVVFMMLLVITVCKAVPTHTGTPIATAAEYLTAIFLGVSILENLLLRSGRAQSTDARY